MTWTAQFRDGVCPLVAAEALGSVLFWLGVRDGFGAKHHRVNRKIATRKLTPTVDTSRQSDYLAGAKGASQ